MADYCTCGAELPPDARFCHKCGKPQYEDPRLEPDEAESEPLVAPPPVPMLPVSPGAITFHNRAAIRTAMLAAIIAIMLMNLPPLGFLRLGAPVVGGFLAVFFYTRRTGELLSIRNGARLGWIAGMLAFVICVVLFTFSVVVILGNPEALGILKEQTKGTATAQDIEQFVNVLHSPAGIAAGLASLFLVLTALPAIGGAIGAKIFHKERSRS